MNDCPCGSELSYELCCRRYIEEKANAPTPSALMRSRYTAFVLGNVNYIGATMKRNALEQFDATETKNWLQGVTWLGLSVLDERLKTPRQGFVTFEAKYLFQNKPEFICEKSEFQKIGDR